MTNIKIINYWENNEVKQLLNDAPFFQKKQITLLKKIPLYMLGKQLDTYVLKNNELKIESSNIITREFVIARSPKALDLEKEIFHDWLIPITMTINNYGQEAFNSLTYEFKPFKKQQKIKAIELTHQVLHILNAKEEFINFHNEQSNTHFVAHVGDFLTNLHYPISKHSITEYDIVYSTNEPTHINISIED